MKSIYHRIFFCVVLFCCSSISSSQELAVEKIKLFEQKDDVVVKTFVVDHKNFIWFVTNNKLYRFDGSLSEDMTDTLENFNLEAIDRLFLDSNQRLWVTSTNTIAYVDLAQWSFKPVPLDFELESTNHFIYETEDGLIVFGYDNGKIVLIDQEETYLIDEVYKSSVENSIKISVRSAAMLQANLWVSTSNGALLKIDPTTKKVIQRHQITANESIEMILPVDDHFIVEIKDKGVYYWDFNQLELIEKLSIENNVHLVKDTQRHMFYFDSKHVFMMNKRKRGSKIYQSEFAEAIPKLNEAQMNQNYILLSNDRGIYSISVRSNGIMNFNPNPTFEKSSMRDIFVFDDGAKFYCSYEGAGYIDTDKKLHHFPNNAIAYKILPIDQDRLLLGTEGSFLEVFDRKTMEIYPFEYKTDLSYKKIRDNSYINALAEDDTYYYIGSYSGLLKVEKSTQIVSELELDSDDISYGYHIRHLSKVEDELIVSTTRGVYQIKEGQLQKLYPKVSDQAVHSHKMIKDTLWLATQTIGLVGIDMDGNQLVRYTKDEGMTSDLVYELAYLENTLFAFTSYGFNAYANGSIKPYYPKNKAFNGEYNHGSIGYDYENKIIYAGGLKNFTTIDFDFPVLDEVTPSYELASVYIVNKDNQAESLHRLSYSQTKDIIVPNYSPYVRLKFKNADLDMNNPLLEYQIPSILSDWIQIDVSKQIELVSLSPGTHQLMIRYPGSQQIQQFKLIKEAYFYQQWWFYVMILLALIGMAYAYFRFRLQLVKNNERMRSRIAADLHDDIGSVLGGILAQSQFASLAPEKTDRILNRIQANAKNGLQSLSDIVWSVDIKNDNWDSFLDKIEVHGNESTQTGPLGFELEVIGTPQKKKLDQKIRQNLWLIFKESLMNCVKHAEATSYQIVFHFSSRTVTIEISDNGKGFKEDSVQLGNGLKNMKMRTELLGATFKLNSIPGKTTIKLEVQL